MNQRSRSVEVAVRTDDDSALSRGGGGAQQQLFSLRPLSPVYLLVPSSSSSSFTTARLRGRTKHVSSGGRLRGIEAVGRLSCPPVPPSVQPRSLGGPGGPAPKFGPGAPPIPAPLPRFSVIAAARLRCFSVRFRELRRKRSRNICALNPLIQFRLEAEPEANAILPNAKTFQRNVCTGG